MCDSGHIFMLKRPTDGSLEACPHGETQPPSILKIDIGWRSMSEVIICFQQTLAQD